MNFEDELLTAIAASLGIPGDRVLSSLKSAGENFIQALTEGTLALPCAFVQFGIRRGDEQMGLEWLSERAPIAIGYYVVPSDAMQGEVRDALLALRTVIEGEDAETWQALERGDVDASEDNVAAAVLLEARAEVFAGTLTYARGLRVAAG